MEKKYLPIGSVCTLKGKNKKVMISGYYSIEFNGNIKISDYCGYVYPEGELLPEQKCNFNHSDIETINFLGYKNEEEEKFKRILNKVVGNEVDEGEVAKDFQEKNDIFLASSNIYSKLLFDDNGVVLVADPIQKTEDKEVKQNIKFSEDGDVISVAEADEKIENPFKKNYSERKEKDTNPSEWNIFDNYEFDEEGTLVNDIENNENVLSKIEFDENGVVISVDSDSLKSNKYTFNEEGILVEVNE